MDGDNGSSVLGQAGYVISGSGGGGASGQYVFANLEQFDDIIAEWEAIHDRIRHRATKLARAKSLIEPPAEDIMSRLQADSAVRSLEKAEEHRQAMENYAADYIARLRAARDQYASTDVDSAAALRKVGGQ